MSLAIDNKRLGDTNYNFMYGIRKSFIIFLMTSNFVFSLFSKINNDDDFLYKCMFNLEKNTVSVNYSSLSKEIKYMFKLLPNMIGTVSLLKRKKE